MFNVVKVYSIRKRRKKYEQCKVPLIFVVAKIFYTKKNYNMKRQKCFPHGPDFLPV